MMNQEEIFNLSFANQGRAKRVLMSSDIANVWEQNGCRVNLIGSLRMGLLASHKDIDLHVYSKDITEESSFAIAAQIAKLPNVLEIKCINGLHTDEHCIAWRDCLITQVRQSLFLYTKSEDLGSLCHYRYKLWVKV